MQMLLNQDLDNILTTMNAICLFLHTKKRLAYITVGECLHYSIQNAIATVQTFVKSPPFPQTI